MIKFKSHYFQSWKHIVSLKFSKSLSPSTESQHCANVRFVECGHPGAHISHPHHRLGRDKEKSWRDWPNYSKLHFRILCQPPVHRNDQVHHRQTQVFIKSCRMENWWKPTAIYVHKKIIVIISFLLGPTFLLCAILTGVQLTAGIKLTPYL